MSVKRQNYTIHEITYFFENFPFQYSRPHPPLHLLQYRK